MEGEVGVESNASFAFYHHHSMSQCYTFMIFLLQALPTPLAAPFYIQVDHLIKFNLDLTEWHQIIHHFFAV